MIRQSDILHTRTLVEAMRYKGKTLAGIPGTPLAELISASAVPLVPQEALEVPMEEGTLSGSERLIQSASMAKNAMGENVHDNIMEELSKYVADKLSATLNYTQNTINPLVRDLVVEADEAGKAALNGKAGDPTIDMVDLHAVYGTSGLATLLESHTKMVTDAAPIEPALAGRLLTDLSLEGLGQTVKTGIPSLDEMAAPLLTSEMLGELQYGALTDAMTSNDPLDTVTNNAELIAFLFLMGVKAGRHPLSDGTSFNSEEGLQLTLALNYFGVRVNRKIERVINWLERGKIVLACSGSNITVLGDVYKTWLEGVGSPEAVIGYCRQYDDAGITSNAGSLYESPAQYKELYLRQQRTFMAQGRGDANAAILTTVRNRLISHVRTEYMDEEPLRLKAVEKVNAFFEANPYSSTLPLDYYVLRAVCTSLDKENSDSFRLLTLMRELMEQDESLDAQSAKLMAVTRLTAAWVVGQMGCVE